MLCPPVDFLLPPLLLAGLCRRACFTAARRSSLGHRRLITDLARNGANPPHNSQTLPPRRLASDRTIPMRENLGGFMLEAAGVTLYDIADCGYYPRASKVRAFGEVATLLDDLVHWVSGKKLGQTQMPKGRGRGSMRMGTYVLDARRTSDRYLVTLWNQVPATDGQVASVRIDSGVNRPAVVMNDIEEGTVPGYATYFYFMPEREQFLAVRFQHPGYGHAALRNYLQSFLRYCGRHVRYEDGDGDAKVMGYVPDAAAAPASMVPKFNSDPHVKRGEHARLVQEAARVVKVVRKSELNLSVPEQDQLWQRMLRWASLRSGQRPIEPVKIQYSMDTTVTPSEMRSLVREWAGAATRGDADWDDLGFMLKGEQSPLWLSHSLARKMFDLDVSRDTPEVVNAPSLARTLVRIEREMLAALV